MIVDIVSTQDQGKTLLAVAILKRLICSGWYQPNEVYANIRLALPGCNIGTSDEIAECMVTMVEKGWRHKVFFLDEIDRIFPARWSKDHEQTERLLGLWQDVKLFHWFIATRHVGLSVDKIYRDAAQLVLVPRYLAAQDKIEYSVINSLDMWPTPLQMEVPNVSQLFPLYPRWEAVN